MAIHKNVDEEIKRLQSARRELVKQEKILKEEKRLQKDMEKWVKIMELRAQCEKMLDNADIGMRFNLKKLVSFPAYYVYQHPTNGKLRTSDRNAEWVKQYLGEIPYGDKGGMTGVEADLIDTARKSTLRTWKRELKKGRKLTTKQVATTKGGGKNASIAAAGNG